MVGEAGTGLVPVAAVVEAIWRNGPGLLILAKRSMSRLETEGPRTITEEPRHLEHMFLRTEEAQERSPPADLVVPEAVTDRRLHLPVAETAPMAEAEAAEAIRLALTPSALEMAQMVAPGEHTAEAVVAAEARFTNLFLITFCFRLEDPGGPVAIMGERAETEETPEKRNTRMPLMVRTARIQCLSLWNLLVQVCMGHRGKQQCQK